LEIAEIAVVGAGPAGLSASIEAARAGARVTLIDENAKPGGQLFKQIHKFFGSKELRAGVRGYDIGYQLLKETEEYGVDVRLNTAVYGIFNDNILGLFTGEKSLSLKTKKIILATGASENPLAFHGWTLPGVMGAGAAQTMINVWRVLPGNRVLVVGSGNVGLVVAYQLLQAGASVLAIVEAAPRIGGYGVHAAKIRRMGVPILTSHTVKEAFGNGKVEGATIAQLDEKWIPIPGTESTVEVDLICVAVGLEPRSELAWLAGCYFAYIPQLGGLTPIHDENMETPVPGLFVAGDVAGVEEASTAMEEGRLAGIAAAEDLGFIEKEKAEKMKEDIHQRLRTLRSGPFGELRFKAKQQLVRMKRKQ
jgi:NADPH-dependent 2,4-dienoyl-CoA reductase/sulfur reductase-like enzyme